MDRRIADYIRAKRIKPLNPILANGLATSHLPLAEQYIADRIKCAMTGCHPDFKFEGIGRCTPQESLAVNTRKRGTRSFYEITDNDLYAIKIQFSWRGQTLNPAYAFIPYARQGRGGMIRIRGALFSVSPVLADKSFSVGGNSIFMPLNGAKLTFYRMVQNVILNNVHFSSYVVWSTVYNRSSSSLMKQERKTITACATMPHYLFCRYGVREAFARFAGVDIKYGYSDTINETTYPPEDWYIVSSITSDLGRGPKGLGRVEYTPSQFKAAIPKKDWTPMSEGLIMGLFYVIDHFPSRITPECIGIKPADVELECELWQLLLAHIVFATDVSEGKLAQDIAPHMNSIANYVDDETREALRSDGIYANDFYELIANIIDTFTNRVMESADSMASMYGKRLMILRYILSPITHSIFKMMYAIRGGKQIMDVDNLNKCLMNFIKPLAIRSINHKHGEVRSVSSSGDNMAFNITSAVVLQTNSSGVTAAKTKDSNEDPSRLLDASIAEVGSYAAVQKAEPTGRGRLNLTVQIAPNGDIVRDESKRELIDSVQRMIKE